LKELKERNVWIIGTSDDAPNTLYQVDLKGPVALVACHHCFPGSGRVGQCVVEP
jgi:hypothetical protein